MAHTFTFVTSRFRRDDEPLNPINPIGGQAALLWLTEQLAIAGFECGAPDAEDWGWYTHVLSGGRAYLLGVSGEWDDGAADTEWTVQLELRRSLWDRVTGANKLLEGDSVSLSVERTLRSASDIRTVSVDRVGGD